MYLTRFMTLLMYRAKAYSTATREVAQAAFRDIFSMPILISDTGISPLRLASSRTQSMLDTGESP